MTGTLFARLPAVAAKLAEGGFANLRSRLPAVTADLASFPPSRVKVYRLYREPLITELAAQAYVPATPGRFEWIRFGPMAGPIMFEPEKINNKTVRILSGRDAGTTSTQLFIDDEGAWEVTHRTLAYVDVTWEERLWIAATPAVPSQLASTVITGKIGWDGGGRGRNRVPVGSRFVFRFNHTVALQAGLASPGARYSFAAPAFAWYRHREHVECTMSGAIVATLSTVLSNQDIKGWRFGIDRRAGFIHWIYATGPDEAFTVFHTEADPGGALVPIGIPYTVGDTIDALVTEEYNAISAALPAVRSLMTDSGQYSRLIVRLAPIEATIEPLETNDLAAELPAVRARMSDNIWGTLVVTMPAFNASLRSEPTFDVNFLYARVPPIAAAMRGYIRISANINATLPAVRSRIEDHSRGRIAATLPPVSARLSDFNRDFGFDLLLADFRHSLSVPLFLVAADGLEVGDTTEIIVIFDLVSAEGVNLQSVSGLGDLVELLVREGLYISEGGSDLARREALQYAVNLATGAASVYQGFDFKGFVSIDDIAYGWRDDGLYRIGANTDDGDTIGALVDFGISDYGRAERKRVPTVWVGLRTDGQTYVKVRADNGNEHVYRTVASPENHKAILAKGVAGRRWAFTLELEDASFASLDSLEIEIAVLSRRFGGD